MLGPKGAAIMMALPLSPFIQAMDVALVHGHSLLSTVVMASRKGDVVVWAPWMLAYAAGWRILLVITGSHVFGRRRAALRRWRDDDEAVSRFRRRLEAISPRPAPRLLARPRPGDVPSSDGPRAEADRRPGFLGGPRSVVRGPARRGPRHHRPKRRRQVHDAQASEPDHAADGRPRAR